MHRSNVFIERALSVEGLIRVVPGEEVKPYTELGHSSADVLLSGVWGRVEDVIPERSVLIKSHAVDLHLVVASGTYAEGELIVFPNPSDLIQRQYLEKFAYSLAGKVIYMGNTVSLDLLKMAEKYGVAGIVAGGCTRVTFDYARKNGFFLGLFSGFGNCKTPDIIFNVLSDVSTRIVFASADARCLRVPMPEGFSMLGEPASQDLFRPLERGLKILVLQTPYFGDTGHVMKVSSSKEDRVLVKLMDSGKTVEVSVPNFLAI